MINKLLVAEWATINNQDPMVVRRFLIWAEDRGFHLIKPEKQAPQAPLSPSKLCAWCDRREGLHCTCGDQE